VFKTSRLHDILCQSCVIVNFLNVSLEDIGWTAELNTDYESIG